MRDAQFIQCVQQWRQGLGFVLVGFADHDGGIDAGQDKQAFLQ